LRNVEDIIDAVAHVQMSVTGDRVLCGYIKIEREGLDIEGIQTELRKSLPDYMIPSHFMEIDHIPVTSNGKLNRKALPKIEISSTKEYVAPTTETEEMIVGIFEEMFGLDQVGIKDSFFELGGNSLKSMLLVNRIEQQVGVRLGIRAIFQGMTVEGISLALQDAEGVYEPIPVSEEKAYYPMSSAQKRLFLIDQIGGANITYNVPVPLRIEGKLDVRRVEDVFKQLARRHEAFRTSFGVVNGELVQYIHEDVEADFVYKERGEAEVLDIDEMMEAFVRPFDLSKAPLIRTEIVKIANDLQLEEDVHVFLFDMHHIISDGASSTLLMSDFMALYEGTELPELRVQYKDYSEWMLTRDLSDQKDYWLTQFEDEIPVLELPIDYPRPMM